MKTYIKSRKSFLAKASIPALATLLVAGCSTVGSHQNDVAANNMQSAAAEVQAESRALELTMGSLKDLMEEPAADLKQPFHHYDQSLDQLVSAARRTEATGTGMARKNAEYLQAWDKELAAIDYQHVRELSQARRDEVSNRFHAINQRYLDSQAVVEPLISYLLDIRHALNADLTSGGLESLKPVAANAQSNAQKLQTALNALSNELNDSGTRLSTITATGRTTE